MLTLLFIGMVVSGLVCLADLIDRVAERRRKHLADVIPLPTSQTHVRVVHRA